jgi:hypothetical protein
MLPLDPKREVAGRSIAAILMARQIKQAGIVQPESVLTGLGALAGFSAQMAIRKAVIEPRQMDPDTVLSEVVTKNGEKYYFGDLLNWIVFENLGAPPYSIWAYVRDAVPESEWGQLPDMGEILGYAARSIGTARFGVPRLPASHMPLVLPRAALHEHWGEVQRELGASNRAPSDWPYDLAFAVQWQMLTSRDHLTLPLAAQVVMEAAIPMSKVDPLTVPGA